MKFDDIKQKIIDFCKNYKLYYDLYEEQKLIIIEINKNWLGYIDLEIYEDGDQLFYSVKASDEFYDEHNSLQHIKNDFIMGEEFDINKIKEYVLKMIYLNTELSDILYSKIEEKIEYLTYELKEELNHIKKYANFERVKGQLECL